MKIKQQTDVCFLIADVNIPCSYMRTLSLMLSPFAYISLFLKQEMSRSSSFAKVHYFLSLMNRFTMNSPTVLLRLNAPPFFKILKINAP